jgi:glycosyltransferase involved in cell wall biosynthesis
MISIVVCTRNRSRLLQGCLNSLAKQSRSDKDYDVIVVDNNSTDDTNEIIKKFVICSE